MSEWVEYREGTGLPLIICVPHDGRKKPDYIGDRTCDPADKQCSLVGDAKTKEIGEGLYEGLSERFGKYPHLVISRLHRFVHTANPCSWPG